MLLAPQPVGLVGRENQRFGAIGPLQTTISGSVDGFFGVGADSQNARLTFDHDVASIVRGRGNDVDELRTLDRFADPLGTRTGFPEAAAREDQPDAPVPGGRQLGRPCPERPVGQ